MGARGKNGGVEPRAASIRIGFTWSGKRRRETLEVDPTPQNIRAAQRLVAQINDEIRHGTFVYARHFPRSEVAKESTELTTFREYALAWLATLTTEHGTKLGYKSTLDNVWLPKLGDRKIGAIRHSEIKTIIAARAAAVSGKTVNNDLIPLRGVFDAAVADEVIAKSPADNIENLKHQSPPPDPFTPDERARILAHLHQKAPLEVWAYYAFAFATGVRPSEEIILRWSKADWGTKTIRIDTARTRGREKVTKTATVRDVDLSPGAIDALAAMKPLTFLKEADAAIFCHPVTRKPWTNDQYQRVTYFHPALKALGIRKRDAYQTRHTFATMALMAGVNPAYIARQMGHSTPAMIFQRYAKWIDGADKGRERAKLEAALSPNCPREGETA